MPKDYPGTLQHQNLLDSIVSYYDNDPRILAILVFGSLGRGNWDSYSDLDLDVVIADEAKIDVHAELRQLTASFAAVNEQAGLIIPDDSDAGDIVLKSLMELSIRYHILSTTSPNIVESFQIVAGRIDRAAIEAAGLANRHLDYEPLDNLLDRCVRHVLGVDVALHRGRIWAAVELLHQIRGQLMELFTRTHDGQRAYQFFEANADVRLQTHLGATLPRDDLKSVQESLTHILDILKQDLEPLSNGQIHLTAIHAEILNNICLRQANFNP
jgi:predicted nucleotidyltransferase